MASNNNPNSKARSRMKLNHAVVKSRPSVLKYYNETSSPSNLTTIVKPKTGQTSFTTTSPNNITSRNIFQHRIDDQSRRALLFNDAHNDTNEDDDGERDNLSPSKIPIGLKFVNTNSGNNEVIDDTFDFLDEEY